jgi:hypothetical protein
LFESAIALSKDTAIAFLKFNQKEDGDCTNLNYGKLFRVLYGKILNKILIWGNVWKFSVQSVLMYKTRRIEMPYQTDERLKNYLDTNQLHREQMCRAILAIDKRYSDVRPRHPRGGPDGGRDIEALFRDDLLTFGAVGFVNQANDSDEQKKKYKKNLQATLTVR